MRSYIPHEAITCDDRNLPWINKDIKDLIHEKNQACKSDRENKQHILFSSVPTTSIRVKFSNRKMQIQLLRSFI